MILISAVLVVIFASLIIRKKYPLIKKCVRLKPNKTAHLDRGVFLLYNKVNGFGLAFIKNFGCRLYLGEGSIVLPFKNFTNYRIHLNRINLYSAGREMSVSAYGIAFDFDSKKFHYEFDKPNFAYRFDRNKQAIFLGEKFSFAVKFIGFKNLELSPVGKFRLQISGEIVSQARLEFFPKCVVAKSNEVREFKRRNFGIIDTTSWDFVPKFSGELNSLQKRNLVGKFSLSARKIELPPRLNIPIIEAQAQFVCGGSVYVDIQKLGIGKVAGLNQIGHTATIVDLLSGVKYKFTADKNFACRLINFFGINYLFVSSFWGKIKFTTTPLFCGQGSKNYPQKLLCGLYQDSGVVDFDSVIGKMNLLILHGFWVDACAIINRLNYRFLAPRSQFLLANMLLNFITTFKKSGVLAKSKFRNIIIRGLCYAMNVKSNSAGCFCEKILPLLKSERAHQRVLLHKLQCVSASDKSCESILSLVLGIVLRGTELTIRPQKNIDIETFVVIRGKRINLKISPNWSKVRINNLSLENVYTFDITKLSSDTLLTFD